MTGIARFFSRILRRFGDEEIRLSIQEYLEHEGSKGGQAGGRLRRDLLYAVRASQILAGLFLENLLWRISMFKSYMTTFLRNAKRQKVYTFLNISGLSLGMACCLFILLFVRDELGFDRFNVRFDRIYRVLTETYEGGRTSVGACTALPLAPALKAELPEVEKVARISERFSTLVGTDGKYFYENLVFADPEFLDIFSFPVLAGTEGALLSEPASLVITERTARKYFGRDDAVGKTLTVGDNVDFKVTGVLRDIPLNSHLRFGLLASFSSLNETNTPRLRKWDSFSNDYTYVLLAEGAAAETLQVKFPGVLKKHLPADLQDEYDLRLQPLKDIRFSSVRADNARTSNKAYVYVFSAVGVFILFIACVNFMNLSTARSSRRAKEVGLRKVVGAGRGQLVRQFFAESTAISLMSLVLAGGLVRLFLPRVNAFLRKGMAFSPLGDAGLLAGMIALALLVGLVSGSYPALFLSSFRPAEVLKKTPLFKGRKLSFRAVTVVLQFSVSIILFIGTMTVYGQMNYMRSRDLGFKAEQIVAFYVLGSPIANRAEAFREEILRNPSILSASFSSGTPASGSTITDSYIPEGRGDDADMDMLVILTDFDFTKTYGLTLAAGRDFSRDFAADRTQSVIINETAARELDWESPVGKQFRQSSGRTFNVVGVVKDFHYNSPHSRIGPMLLAMSSSVPEYLSVKMRPENAPQTLAFLEKTWKAHAPRNPFSYFFIDEEFEYFYIVERRLGTIFSACALLAVLISCLGIFGLASFSAEQRTKEIGIRKTLGASVPGILRLLSREFLGWITIASFIAWPVAYWVMHSWLREFPYRMTMGPWMFILAALAALILALLTISVQSVRAAVADPVASLRYE